MRCDSTGDLYPLFSHNQAMSSINHSAFSAVSPDIWHHRLGHPGDAVLHNLHSQKFINCNKSCISFCSSCSIGKHSKLPFYDSLSYTHLPFDIIHSDVWTSPIVSSLGHRYYVLFLDGYSKFLWAFPIAKKSQVKHLFLTFHAFVKTQFERNIKTFQCDNGTEYINGTFDQFFNQHGMVFRLSCPHTSPQNGKAERHIKSINNIIRTLLLHASMPPTFWHHALSMAIYLLNILPSKVLDYLSPTQILYHCNPNYSNLRVFGCLCFPLFPSTSIHKLQERSTPCVYLGPAPNHRGSKCYNMSSGKIIICRHVRFIENIFPFSKIKNVDKSTYDFLDDNSSLNHFLSHNPNIVQSTTPPSSIERPSPHSGPNSLASPNSLQTTIPHSISQGLGFPSQPNPSVTPSSPIPHAVTPPRPEHLLESENPTPTSPTPQIHSSSTQQHIPATMQRTHHMTTRSINGIFKPNPTFHTNLTVDTTPEISPIPKNPVSALRDKNWKTAMWDEFIALIDNNTWELVPKPSNVNVIRSMWIFRHKYKSDGSFERYKARLVGNGNTQQQGVDCDETFSPVVKPATIRAVLQTKLFEGRSRCSSSKR